MYDKKILVKTSVLILLFCLQILQVTLLNPLYAQTPSNKLVDTTQEAKSILKESRVQSELKEIKLTIQNVDIGAYPIVKVICEAYNVYGDPLDTLYAEKLFVMENGVEKPVISVEKISVKERVPIDFVFVIDQTGTMQSYIDAVKKKVSSMVTFLKDRGIDYKLGLILFSDEVDKIYQPTNDVNDFLGWLSRVKASGGGDIKENALEALNAATAIEWRPSANRVAIIITDAPYHQVGENGQGKTIYNTESITQRLAEKNIRLFSIVPPRLTQYEYISQNTRGNVYDIDYPFSSILDNFSIQLTNLFALKYRTFQPAIPDSIDIAVVNEFKQQLTRKTIPIVELGRKLIIENMLYTTGKAELPMQVPELNVLTEFLKNKPNVTILIEGHTDDVGLDKTNDRLSKMRAESVKNYLIAKGIPAYRMKTMGYGKRKPIASNLTDWGRKLNRRTEIIIISK
jgi:outer membrane protein OmpA-like peptidoglycan-associated protein/Mg-chelatase subunit ChlD